MITKDQLLASMRHETRVIQHLAAKVPAGQLGYRPTPGQRSTEELLRYMTRMAIVPTMYALDGTWERAEGAEASAAAFPIERFAEEMDAQMASVEAELEGLDETDATTRPAAMPWGTPTTLGAGLMDMALKTLVAYRMQLFLYVKASGVHDIGPANCWAGVDMPRQPAG